MKYMNYAFALVLLGALLFGFVLPALISAGNTEAVLLGTFTIVLLVYLAIRYLIKAFQEKHEDTFK